MVQVSCVVVVMEAETSDKKSENREPSRKKTNSNGHNYVRKEKARRDTLLGHQIDGL